MSLKYSFETNAVHGYKGYDETTGAVSFPIYQSATFRHPGLNQSTGYDYSRLQNPTREEVERTVALLDGGKEGLAFSSGMAAVSTVLKLFKAGDHVLVCDDLYGGVYRIFEEVYSHFGISASYIDMTEIAELEKHLRPNTKAVWLETPTNPTMKVIDIQAVADFAKKHGCITIVDNTFLTAYLQKPLALGADIALYSGTKYLAGHNDTLAGFVITSDDQLIERLRLLQKSEGAVLAPFDSWLVLRGIKTLPLRMDKHSDNAKRIAEFLTQHPRVKAVHYPGLPSHKGYDIMENQASGFGGMISFEVENALHVESVLQNVKLIMFAESLGGTETLITYPLVQTHSAIPEELREKIGINDRLLRISAGIENADDIIADLKQALEA